jgi:hypothetical protein
MRLMDTRDLPFFPLAEQDHAIYNLPDGRKAALPAVSPDPTLDGPDDVDFSEIRRAALLARTKRMVERYLTSSLGEEAMNGASHILDEVAPMPCAALSATPHPAECAQETDQDMADDIAFGRSDSEFLFRD